MTASVTVTSRSGRIWAWVPALLLGSMLAGMGVLVSIAVDDPHFALEPSYYDKAVHWDRARAEARASERVGLRLEVAPLLHRATDGRVEVEVAVEGRSGAPFVEATVELEAFPNAYRKEAQHLTLREVTPGVYRGTLERGVLGLWELRFAVARGAEKFHGALRRDVVPGGAA